MNRIIYSNDQKLKIGKEILELKLDYDSNFSLDNNSFGLELEFSNARLRTVSDELYENNLNNWKVYIEPTVCTTKKSYEIVTRGGEVVSPIFYGTKEDWLELKKVCDLIKFCLGEINEKTAGHIHVGSQIFKNYEELNNFLFAWSSFENIIKRFFYGEYIEGNFFTKLALDCKEEFYLSNYNYQELLKLRQKRKRSPKTYAISFAKTQSFNFEEDNTIEFRAICGSLDEEIWQNNLRFLNHFINWSKNLSTAEIKNIKQNYVDTYEFLDMKLNFDKALFLADCIFDNNIDKLYFLKQYFKDFYIKNETINKIELIKKKTI